MRKKLVASFGTITATRVTEADYKFAVLGGRKTTFHRTDISAIVAAKRNGGHVVPVTVQEKKERPKFKLTLDDVVRISLKHGLRSEPGHDCAGGSFPCFVKEGLIVQAYVGHQGEMKGPVLVMKDRRTTHRVEDVKGLEDALAGE